MPTNPNKLTQFWQELKRRKVLRVIAMYAGGAYVLLELVNNVLVPLNLPDWSPRLVIIIALVGLPIMVVLSWIFDITPEGIGKTESLDELSVQEQAPSPGKRRLKVSDVIIVVLVVVVGILVYPRVFGTGSLNAMTVPVTVMNEFGKKETRRVFKDDYISRLAIFPFNNEVNDSLLNWLDFGIMDAIYEDHLQFSNILIEWDDATHLNEQLAYAREINYPYFLTGNYNVTNGLFEITIRLYQTANGALRVKHVYRGGDFFSLVDSICVQVRSDLGISEIILNATPDLSIADLITNNLEAYENYIRGRYYWHYNRNAYSCLNMAIELDSTFALACYRQAILCYNYQESHESAISSISQAIRHRHRLSEFNDNETRILNYLIHGEEERVIKLLEYQNKLKPQDFNLLFTTRKTYGRLHLLDRMEDVALRINEVVPNHPPYQILLAECYMLSGKPDKGLDVLNELLTDNPEHVEALLKIGEAYLHKNDLAAAEEVFNQAIFLMPEEERHWTKLLDHIAYMRDIRDAQEVMESVEGTYRADIGEWNTKNKIFQNQLFNKLETQSGVFIYPLSDTVFVFAFKNAPTFDFVTVTFIRNSQGKVIQQKGEQWSGSDYDSSLYWKEDNLILEAKDLLGKGQAIDALSVFREAYGQNPEHYYLANFIHHLEFILSPDYESFKHDLNDLEGEYGEIKLHVDGGQFYYTDHRGLIFQLLPLAVDWFMVPSIYAAQVHMIKEKGAVTGIKIVYRDGREEFYPRI